MSSNKREKHLTSKAAQSHKRKSWTKLGKDLYAKKILYTNIRTNTVLFRGVNDAGEKEHGDEGFSKAYLYIR